MTNVFMTFDVEIWPDRWDLDPANFCSYFDRYIMGKTSAGFYGLPYLLNLAEQYDLKFVFFVEPLFASEFGIEPLNEIVDMIHKSGQEVQLHLHAEWVLKGNNRILPHPRGILLRDYPLDEQTLLISKGLEYLKTAGANEIIAFRAGSFGANVDTLSALRQNNILIDASYNLAAKVGPMLPQTLVQPTMIEGIKEFPLSVYRDWPRGHRHAQIAASSFSELEKLSTHALDNNWHSLVILSHSAELLDGTRRKRDPIVIRRFEKYCQLLADNRKKLPTRWFSDINDEELPLSQNDSLMASPLFTIGSRYFEQALRHLLIK